MLKYIEPTEAVLILGTPAVGKSLITKALTQRGVQRDCTRLYC